MAAACALVSLPAAADPQLLGYQGRLLRADGTAATGTASVTFAIHDAASGGSPLWTETQTLGLAEGYYATFLGMVTPPPQGLFDGADRWLELKIGTEPLVPRARLGSVSYAATAHDVVGGTANVSSLEVAGQTVVDAAGRLAGSAKYGAGAGIAVDDASQTISLGTCTAGQVLQHDGTTWRCAAAAVGSVTQVSAAAPLSVTDADTAPLISLPQAGSVSAGYLSAADWTSFNAKYGALTQCGGDLSGSLSAPVVARLQSRPVSAAAPAAGMVLKWEGTQWEPAADANSGGTVTRVTAIAPLTAWNGTSTPQISIGPASDDADGYLTSSDWSRFDAKYDAATQCGGDLDGSLPNPLVKGIRGFPVVTTAPATAQVLRFDGSNWAPASLGIADVGGLSSGYVDLDDDQTLGGTKTFTSAPVFQQPLSVSSGGTGTSTAAQGAVFAGPAVGSDAPAFRALVLGDLPDLDASRVSLGMLSVARGGTGTSVAFASGSLVFAGAAGGYAHDALLRWDDAAGRLGIGTSAPGDALHVEGTMPI